MKDCQIVFHLAALISIPYSYTSPLSYVDTNIKGTLNILKAAKDLSIDKVIHTSTSEIYGSAQFVPITEDHPMVGQSPYSASKIAADQLAISFWKSFDLPITILRPSILMVLGKVLEPSYQQLLVKYILGKRNKTWSIKPYKRF